MTVRHQVCLYVVPDLLQREDHLASVGEGLLDLLPRLVQDHLLVVREEDRRILGNHEVQERESDCIFHALARAIFEPHYVFSHDGRQGLLVAIDQGFILPPLRVGHRESEARLELPPLALG